MSNVDYKPGERVRVLGLSGLFIHETTTFVRQLTDEENQMLPAPYNELNGGNGLLVKVDDLESRCKVNFPDSGPGVIVLAPNSVGKI
jgi:hypothetical protein